MSAGEHRFRKSMFGFNRQDVVHYLESLHRDYAAKLQSVKQELDKERGKLTTATQEGAVATETATAAGKEAQRAKEELTTALEQLQGSQSKCEELRLKLKALEEDYTALQEATDRMAPSARAYESLKDKAATIELDAHHRAQEIIKEGEAQAAHIRQEVRQWLTQVESSYSRLKSDVAATMSHAVTELERTGRSLNRVTEELDDHGLRLKDMAQELEKAEQAAQKAPVAEGPGVDAQDENR